MPASHRKFIKSALLLNLNNGEIMARSIERLLQEDKTEILIVDNASKDNTIDVLKKYIQENPERVRAWRWKKVKGQSYNRNLMIKQSRGKYLLFLDTDILYHPGSFDYLIQRLENAPKEIRWVGFDPWYYTNKEEEADKELPPLDVPLSFKGQPIALTQYGVCKKSLFSFFHIKFDERYGTGYGCEDNDLALQMLHYGLKCASVPFKYYHNKHTPHWWSLHNPKFMRIEERRKYFLNKWGRDAFERYYKLQNGSQYKNDISKRLLEEQDVSKLDWLSAERRRRVEEYLKLLQQYKRVNPKKYEQKKWETIRKLNKLLFE